MSLTVSSHPYNIDNSASFTIDTDLVEDSTHVNLRIRAEIYQAGEIRAVLEKPKGLTNFDFADILKSLNIGLKFARDSGDLVKTGSVSANLLTNLYSNYSTSTFGVPSNIVIELGEASLPNRNAMSNAIPVVKGQMYVFYVQNYVNHFAGNPPVVKFYDDSLATCELFAQSRFAALVSNKSYLFMCTQSGTLYINLENATPGNSFGGDFYFKNITTNPLTEGSNLVSYFPMFTEVWEDSTGVTSFGTTSQDLFIDEGLFRFVPAKGDSLAFNASHVLKTSVSKFANQTFKNSAVKFFTYLPNEYWINFFTDNISIELFYSKDGAAYTSAIYYCYEGWGAVILNIGELMSGVTTSLRFYFKDIAATTISEVFTVYPNTEQIDERSVLEYDGILGGKEYLAFEGKKDLQYPTIRKYYTGSKKGRKALELTGLHRQYLETRFKDILNTVYLKHLMISEVVKRLELSYAAPTEVTIVSDSVKVLNSELFVNSLEIEYEDD